MSELHITTPEGEEFIFNLDAESYTIGRADENTMVVPDASISGTHARFIKDNNTYILEDLGSTNGTRVNGNTLSQPVHLKPGDSVEFGSVRGSYSPELTTTSRERTLPASYSASQILQQQEPPVTVQTSAAIAFGPKPKTKDPIGTVAMALGVIALITCLALIGASFLMKVG